jgi:DNA-binding transcriptional ArsR family regulator
MDDKSIMVPLDDVRAKYIAEVIGNKSCKKILDYLAENDASVSEVALKLKMPLNTVDYNIKKLLKADLIEKISHWWSVKGKKMPIYRVSNKKVVIYPKQRSLRTFLWTGVLVTLGALSLRQILNQSTIKMGVSRELATEMAFDEVLESTTGAVNFASPSIWVRFVEWLSGIGAWEWFLIGAWLAIVIFFGVTLYNERRNKL